MRCRCDGDVTRALVQIINYAKINLRTKDLSGALEQQPSAECKRTHEHYN